MWTYWRKALLKLVRSLRLLLLLSASFGHVRFTVFHLFSSENVWNLYFVETLTSGGNYWPIFCCCCCLLLWALPYYYLQLPQDGAGSQLTIFLYIQILCHGPRQIIPFFKWEYQRHFQWNTILCTNISNGNPYFVDSDDLKASQNSRVQNGQCAAFNMYRYEFGALLFHCEQRWA